MLVSFGFSTKPVTSPLCATSTTPKAETSSGEIGSVARVTSAPESLCCVEHPAVVHLVDVVAGENEDVPRLLGADGIDVLVDGVGGAGVPVLADALHGRKDLDELAEFIGDHRPPAFADVAIEGERLVLGKDVDATQIGVDAVGQRDVDDAVLPGKRNGRLGTIAGQGKQPFTGATGKQNTKRISHIRRPQTYNYELHRRMHKTADASSAETRVYHA